MIIFFAVCAGLFLAAVIVVSVYLVQTLVQVRRTARSYEVLADRVSEELGKVQSFTNAAARVSEFMGGTVGRTASLVFHLVSGFVKNLREEKGKGSPGESSEGRDASRL